MLDLDTNKLILSKPVRRKTFVLGKSVALLSTTVAVMDDGAIRVMTERRPEYWDGLAPLSVCFKVRPSSDGDNFAQTVQRVREFEACFITAELPELD
ncbi:hypothetical protein OHB13_12010 [Streptomyces sp. NBC_00440]|uniref:hypothetical protein n=1 Tax=Streptomyces sp. NBC_00440 TaxID=2975741 RepID=UPI002E2294EA